MKFAASEHDLQECPATKGTEFTGARSFVENSNREPRVEVGRDDWT